MLTNVISEECPTFALFKSVFRLHLLYVVFKLCALKVKGLENFQAFAFCLKLRVNGDMLRFSIAFIKLQLHDAIYRIRFYSNLLIHILSLSNLHNNVASIQKNRDDKSHRVIVA